MIKATGLMILKIIVYNILINLCAFAGIDRFMKDVEMMVGYQPGRWWSICLKFITPSIIAVSFLNKSFDFACFFIVGLHVH